MSAGRYPSGRINAPYSGIEETSADPKENPGIDGQGESKGQTNIEQLGRVRRGRDGGAALALCLRVGDLCAREGEEEEEHGAGKLAAHGYEMVPDAVRHKADERHPLAMISGAADIHDSW